MTVNAEADPRQRTSALTAELDLAEAMAIATALVSRRNGHGGVSRGLETFGDIDLPEASPGAPEDRALIQSAATLYFVSQLELAGVISSAELLCGLAMSGGIQVDLGAASNLIAQFWEGRNHRFHEKERQAFFAHLFGSDEEAVNSDFEGLMISLCESLYKLDDRGFDENYGSPEAQMRARTAARNVANNLSRKGGGMTLFAAREILATVQEAINILKQPPVQHAFGVNRLWDVVDSISKRYGHGSIDVQNYVRRGKSGLVVLSWIADSFETLEQTRSPLVTLDHPVIAAAEEWLEASLAIREAVAAVAGH